MQMDAPTDHPTGGTLGLWPYFCANSYRIRLSDGRTPEPTRSRRQTRRSTNTMSPPAKPCVINLTGAAAQMFAMTSVFAFIKDTTPAGHVR